MPAKAAEEKRIPVDLFVKGTTWAETMHGCADKARATSHIRSDVDLLLVNIWDDGEIEKYKHFLDKRKRMEDIEKTNIENFIATGGGL